MTSTIAQIYRGRPIPAKPSDACHRWLEAEHRWCARTDLAGRWQVGWLCHAHAPEIRVHMIEPA